MLFICSEHKMNKEHSDIAQIQCSLTWLVTVVSRCVRRTITIWFTLARNWPTFLHKKGIVHVQTQWDHQFLSKSLSNIKMHNFKCQKVLLWLGLMDTFVSATVV